MRSGYTNDFLPGFFIEMPTPNLAVQGDILQPPGLPEGKVVVPYIHYSLLMSKSTKQALCSAANVDNSKQQTISGAKGRKWFIDDRVGKEHQIINDAYTGTPWDRGHLTRRTAVTWGDYSTALAASNDSCAFTNACMQHENFNEDEWRVPELAVANFNMAKENRLNIMTGPVFTLCDRFFTKGPGFDPVRIPSGFWKTITYVDANSGELITAAYLFFQDIDTLKTKKAKQRIQLRNFRITTTELQLWTGLQFDKQMFDSNPLKFYSGPEAVKVTRLKDLSDPTEALLAAGIAETAVMEEARTLIELDKLYELIDELSWY
ncbi:DNA/RNA non-specific endonuclease [Vibrio mangrovi]|uniref:DNA/RNA non-specific endonuclease n=1 Tax=Vibrio mangrovi TaxID=474394 RepID=A0A1Y6IQ88_9VIBR|nr:DNA/RNA non-specific endonuclease [Vibrio mangrovi]MDW6003973.1 DNA/RNA non-specific endonuclease [Vibrio mangrovi]SMR99231.1 DNA/RNA non-specific endonuclease [Vibrio mangrovi]